MKKITTQTRQADSSNVKLTFITKTTKLQSSFLPKAIKFNNLPPWLKQIDSLKGLSETIKTQTDNALTLIQRTEADMQSYDACHGYYFGPGQAINAGRLPKVLPQVEQVLSKDASLQSHSKSSLDVLSRQIAAKPFLIFLIYH